MATVSLFHPQSTVAHKSNAFNTAFAISLVLVSIPIKNFAYIAPAVYLLFQFLSGERRLIFRVMGLAIALTIVSSVSLLIDSERTHVNLPGMLLALLTYLPLLIAVCHPALPNVSREEIERLQTTCAWFVIVQSLIGVLQFAMSGNPDTVCGTFGLLDFRHPELITISQVYFTFTVFSMLLFMSLNANRPLIRIAIGVGLLACILAQSGHQTIFLAATLGAFALVRITRPRFVLMALVGIVAMFVLTWWLSPETLTLASEWRHKILDEGSPKRMAVEAGVAVMDSSKNLLVGTGLGQFTSRAALITSNDYLSLDLPHILVGKSTYYVQHIEPANRLFEEYGEGSAIYKPYFSLLSLVVEIGVLGCLGLSIALAVQFFRNARFMRNKDRWVSLAGTLANVGLVFFLLCCAIENYAEFTQAIFLPILLYIAATSRAQTLVDKQAAAAGGAR